MPQGEILKRLTAAIEKGKAWGYDEFIEIEGVTCYRQFALRLKPEGCMAYVFTVPQAQMDIIEDYDMAEQIVYTAFVDAVAFLQARGADLSRFKAFKASCPI